MRTVYDRVESLLVYRKDIAKGVLRLIEDIGEIQKKAYRMIRDGQRNNDRQLTERGISLFVNKIQKEQYEINRELRNLRKSWGR